VQDSHLKSAIGSIEAYTHDAIGAYRAVRRWIAPSEFALEKAVQWGAPRDRLRLLPHGLERRTGLDENGERRWPSAPPPAAPAGVPAEPFVLFAGRVSVEKGVKLLPELARALGATPLIVAGEGPLLGELQAAASTTPNLKLLGRLEGAAFAALRASARVVIVPSLFYETYGYAVAEALLDARPVVASRIGALPELVEHERTGLLVPPGDAAALIAAVRRALTESRAMHWGSAGRERVLAAGDPRLHTQGLLAIYHEAGAVN
jgi:glycosyltransferase involved in cell wall biosynthesis